MATKGNNKVVEKRLTTLEVLMINTREDVKDIKTQVSNHLPSKIDELRMDLNRNNLANKVWLIGILITVILLLASVILK